MILSNGETVDCDLVVAAIGVTPNKDLVRGTSIAAARAILVDDHCRTNVANIYAAGDCAAIFDPLFGKHRLVDHWDSADITGAIAGRNMAGADSAYDAVNYFSTAIFDRTVHVWGAAKLVERRLLRGTPGTQAGEAIEFGVASDGRLAQVLAMGEAPDAATLRELVQRRFHILGHEESLKDPTVPLARFLEK